MTYYIRAITIILTRSIELYQMEFCNSFILDTEADGYICNNRVKFLTYITAERSEFVVAGDTYIDILR